MHYLLMSIHQHHPPQISQTQQQSLIRPHPPGGQSLYRIVQNGAITIQKHFRGYKVRKTMAAAVVTNQKKFRLWREEPEDQAKKSTETVPHLVTQQKVMVDESSLLQLQLDEQSSKEDSIIDSMVYSIIDTLESEERSNPLCFEKSDLWSEEQNIRGSSPLYANSEVKVKW